MTRCDPTALHAADRARMNRPDFLAIHIAGASPKPGRGRGWRLVRFALIWLGIMAGCWGLFLFLGWLMVEVIR